MWLTMKTRCRFAFNAIVLLLACDILLPQSSIAQQTRPVFLVEYYPFDASGQLQPLTVTPVMLSLRPKSPLEPIEFDIRAPGKTFPAELGENSARGGFRFLWNQSFRYDLLDEQQLITGFPWFSGSVVIRAFIEGDNVEDSFFGYSAVQDFRKFCGSLREAEAATPSDPQVCDASSLGPFTIFSEQPDEAEDFGSPPAIDQDVFLEKLSIVIDGSMGVVNSATLGDVTATIELPEVLFAYLYLPKTWTVYAREAIERGLEFVAYQDGINFAALLGEARAELQRLRTFGPETSAKNLEARDAEYCVIGMQGGWLNQGGLIADRRIDLSVDDLEQDIDRDINYWGARGGPFAWAAYSLLKAFDDLSQKARELGTFAGLPVDLSTNLSGAELPASPIGGLSANTTCWLAGEVYGAAFAESGADPLDLARKFLPLQSESQREMGSEENDVATTRASEAQALAASNKARRTIGFGETEWLGRFFSINDVANPEIDLGPVQRRFQLLEVSDGSIESLSFNSDLPATEQIALLVLDSDSLDSAVQQAVFPGDSYALADLRGASATRVAIEFSDRAVARTWVSVRLDPDTRLTSLASLEFIRDETNIERIFRDGFQSTGGDMPPVRMEAQGQTEGFFLE